MKRNKAFFCLEYVLLLALSLLGNIFSIPLFFGVDLLFGSVGIFLIFFRFGLLPAIPAVVISSAYTLILWNHPYAAIIFILELIVSGLVYKKFNVNILFVNMGFWAIIGIPLVFLFYHFILTLPLTSVFLVALKQSANGILNVLIAFVLFNFLFHQIQKNIPRDSLRQYRVRDLLFVLFILFLSVPIAILIHITGNNEFHQIEEEIVESLNRDSREIGSVFDDWIADKVRVIHQLSEILQNKELHFSDDIQEILELTARQNPAFHNIYVADANAVTISFFPLVNELGDSTIGLDFSDRDYYRELKNTYAPVLSEVFLGRGGVFEPIVTISAPIMKNGVFLGFVLGALKLDYLNTLLQHIYQSPTNKRTLVDNRNIVISSTKDLEILDKYQIEDHWSLKEIGFGVLQGYQKNGDNLSSIQKWNNSIYLRIIPLGYKEQWKLISEIPARPFIARLNNLYIISLLIMLGLINLSIVIAYFISKIILRPIKMLHDVTANLTEEIQNNKSIQWPETGMIEVSKLIENFKRASSSLKVTMHILRESKDILELRVKERTQELISANEELVRENDERKKLEQLLRLQERAIQSTEEGIVITDSIENDCQVIFINKSFEKITGYTLVELGGKNLRLLHGEETDRETTRVVTEALKNQEAVTVEILNYKKNGQTFWNLLNISPIFDQEKKISHYIGITQDISSRKEYEFDLQLAKEQAEEANRAKSQFLSNMSHEIRTPMNHIVYMLGFLEATQLTAEQLSYVQRLKDSSHLLMLLINDVLDLSRIESGKLVLENIPFRFNKVMKEIVEIIEDLCASKSIYLIYKKDPLIADHFIGDSHRFKQILMNLLSNAVKFTHTGGVRLLVESGEKTEESQEIIVRIIDTGIGISDEKKSKIFERFTQVDSSTTRKYGGTGIGLSICKSFIELMGGEIVIEDNPEGGSIFILTIPLLIAKQEFWDKDAIETLQSLNTAVSTFLNGYRVLFAEDDELNRMILCRLLEPYGVQITEAHDGNDVVQKYKAGSFDLILMDIQMPGLDGYSATREIRNIEKIESRKKIPILALTALAFETEIQKSAEAGMDGHVTKPINFQILMDKIKEVLNIKNEIEQSDVETQDTGDELTSSGFYSMKTVIVDKVLEKINNDYSLYLRLIKLFIKQYSPMMDLAYFRGMDLENARKIVHTLIPSSYNIGAFELYDYLKMIYKKMNTQDSTDNIDLVAISSQLSEVIPELQNIVDILESQIAQLELKGLQTEPGPNDMNDEIISLQKKLRVNDLTAVKTAQVVIRRLERNYRFLDRKLIELIKETIEDLDFSRAEEALSKVLKILNSH